MTAAYEPPAIEIENLSAAYRGQAVVADLNLTIGAGDLLGLAGPNGAGKTTLLRCIAGLHVPSRGTVRLFGRLLAEMTAQERARCVAVVPQSVETPMAFTVEEIVMMGRTASLSRWQRPGRKDVAIAERAMVYADVVDMKDRPVNELSGGEKQRVIVAMALAQEPRVILMDEATSHLDIHHRLEIMQLVERLNIEQGVTVAMVSHDLNLTAEFCRRVLLMKDGRLLGDGSPQDVFTETLLRQAYPCNIQVHHTAAGAVNIVPAPRLNERTARRDVRVHVVCGGGCGGEILRRLSLGGYAVTCGVLNEGDSDARVATALGLDVALEKPFLPVGPTALEGARAMVAEATIMIVAPVPFGTGNVANLQLAEEALAQGKRVLIMEGVESRDYTPGLEAAAKAHALRERGAMFCGHTAELFERIQEIHPAAGLPICPPA